MNTADKVSPTPLVPDTANSNSDQNSRAAKAELGIDRDFTDDERAEFETLLSKSMRLIEKNWFPRPNEDTENFD